MNLIVNLNESVRVLGSRFENFHYNIEDKVNKIHNEYILLKNKVDFIEKNCMPSSKVFQQSTSSHNSSTLGNHNNSYYGAQLRNHSPGYIKSPPVEKQELNSIIDY